MQDIYERRKSIHDQRREASEGLRKEMSSGVKHEIQEELREKMDELDAHTRTDFPIEGEVMDAIDSLDQMVILAKREGIDDHFDDIIDQCDILAAVAAASADAHDSRLI